MRVVVLLPLYASLLSLCPLFLAKDVLNIGDKIIGNESTLVSVGNIFEMGFFSLNGSSNSSNSYLGIWYYSREPQTVVWVANRDDPVVNSTGVFQILKGGNLTISDTDGNPYWSSTLPKTTPTNRTVLKLMDSGNLVLGDNQLVLWQSFDHPTDTFLAGMKMVEGFKLISWRDSNDPGRGNFTFKLQVSDGRYIILRNASQIYWLSETNDSLHSEDTIPNAIVVLLTNFTLSNDPYSRSGYPRKEVKLSDYVDTRLVMNSTGQIQQLRWNESSGNWDPKWFKPADQCDKHNACGNFSTCNINNTIPCNCLPGFSPRFPDREDFYDGCVRKSAPCGQDTSTRFLDLKMIKVVDPDSRIRVSDETECGSVCRNNYSQCLAYSYDGAINTTLENTSCWIWSQDLPTLQVEHPADGRSISVRVEISDRASIVRACCEPCGLNIIPYPLSTGPNCGDPSYLKFKCDYSTGQLIFITSRGNYRVTSIDSPSRNFYIQVKDRYSCAPSFTRNKVLELPFNVTHWCPGGDEVEVSWQPPSEPPCNKPIDDCKDWTYSTCIGNEGGKRCLCDSNYVWDGANLTCAQRVSFSSPGPEGPTTKSGENSKIPLSLILVVAFASIFVVACLLVIAYLWMKKTSNRQDRLNVRGRMFDSERRVKDLIDLKGLEENDNEGIEVPYYDFKIILAATDNFSDANKLGKGGYGPVYKGKLPEGQDIAVKRLSSASSQGLQEFKNEVVLIAKLQHRNLVRLRGYCIKGDEKILLYEYMPNKSLDALIFDPTKSVLLDWRMRFDIILGVARGLLYLHQDSRLRIIHRDLKTNNILLDEEMNPKISNFGLARIFEGKETEANTERVVGTYGYMSPEYALDGLFSIKSDVFSFGVILLEIVSGRKNSGFYQSKHTSSLLGHAWRLWTENKLADLMDPSLRENCNTNQFIKCVNIGLLCVQDEPGDRPTMSSVVTMLDGETVSLPNPKQPTFFMSRGLSSAASSSNKPEISMQFQSSCQEGR